jgi:zinc protease
MRITIFGNHRRLVLLAALGTLLCLTTSMPARAGISDAVKAQTLPNGLRVLVLENHKAPLATFNVFYRVGSRNEQFGKTGL